MYICNSASSAWSTESRSELALVWSRSNPDLAISAKFEKNSACFQLRTETSVNPCKETAEMFQWCEVSLGWARASAVLFRSTFTASTWPFKFMTIHRAVDDFSIFFKLLKEFSDSRRWSILCAFAVLNWHLQDDFLKVRFPYANQDPIKFTCQEPKNGMSNRWTQKVIYTKFSIFHKRCDFWSSK